MARAPAPAAPAEGARLWCVVMPGALPTFSLTTSRTAEQIVLSVSGEIDIATVEEFASAAREQLALGPVLLDFEGLSFMDSSGLRALIGLLRESEQNGWSLAIRANLHENIKRLLEMTGMLHELPLREERPPTSEQPKSAPP
jgi:anti-anti-sigma factor